MRRHPLYRTAKDGLDNQAALDLVDDLMSTATTERIRQLLNGALPQIVPVHAEEAAGRNKIPVAYATVLAASLGLSVELRIIQASVANHGGAPSIYHRFASQPVFDGPVDAGKDYLIVDDTCTAGGTLANLKGFIEVNGGRVLAMSVLALHRIAQPYWISLAESTLTRLRYRHPRLDAFWRKEFECGIDTLTEGEAGHLLKAPSVDAIRDRLSAARRDLNRLGDGPSAEGETEETHDHGDTPTREPTTHP